MIGQIVTLLSIFLEGADFSASTSGDTFTYTPSGNRMHCADANIIADGLLEESIEFFSIELTSPDSSVNIPTGIVFATIQDSDSELPYLL